jgi:glucoamylase
VATIEHTPKAFGAPGIEPRWTRGAKEAVGTAYSTSSRVWFTVSGGILSEIYYPTIDRPQVRDLQYLVTDGETFFHDIRRHLNSTVEYVTGCGLGIRIVNEDPDGRYRLINHVIGDPHQACVLIQTRLEGDQDFLSSLRLYVLLAPHLEVGGWGNTGNVTRIAGHSFLTAHKSDTWLALAADVPFLRNSCGYVGARDGWQEIARSFKVEHEFAAAGDGNIALSAELDLHSRDNFTLGLAFGHSLHRAVTTLFQSLGIPFDEHSERMRQQWDRACSGFAAPAPNLVSDGGALYHRSHELLLSHEDKSYPGAIIASMSIPWGETKSDDDLGGYHLVWTRDMVNSATGLLAAGDTTTPLRALTYLACSQQPDGGFPQNFWIDGRPYWLGIQLDEVAFPIMLAWRLRKANALGHFDPYPMVLLAARYLVMHGPVTPQERWEENSGYSPSTLASIITALVCAACWARERGDEPTARFLEEYADFVEEHVEIWTVTRNGTLVQASRATTSALTQ